MTIQDQVYLRRHGIYEKRFAKAFYVVLYRAQRQIAQNLIDGIPIDQIDTKPMHDMYKRLYLEIMRKEGAFIWNLLVAPVKGQEIKQKDVFDEMASILQPQTIEELLTLWTSLMNGFLTYYIGQRIIEVMKTTVKQANEMIIQGRSEGLTDKEIANKIRTDRRVRELRANTIARTESTTAINKAWILSLESSGLQYEKAWTAIRDDRTRDSHWETDPSFWIGIKESFMIGGFPMAYPGDNSQGSPIVNIINCRCYLRFRQVGSRTVFRPKQ
jgi:hypothetical protein